MNREKIELIKRHKQFQSETGLLLHIIWQWHEYDEYEMGLVNNAIVNDYFKNPIVKEMLTSVNGKGLNNKGLDIRDVAQSYINHYKKVYDVKPKVFQ